MTKSRRSLNDRDDVDEDDNTDGNDDGSNDNDDDVFLLPASLLERQSSCIASSLVQKLFIHSLHCSLARLQK